MKTQTEDNGHEQAEERQGEETNPADTHLRLPASRILSKHIPADEASSVRFSVMQALVNYHAESFPNVQSSDKAEPSWFQESSLLTLCTPESFSVPTANCVHARSITKLCPTVL